MEEKALIATTGYQPSERIQVGTFLVIEVPNLK